MSLETAREFMLRVAGDESLKQKLDAIKRGDQINLDEVVQLGAAHGFEFDTNDLQAYLSESAPRALEELDLNKIAGGRLYRTITGTEGVKSGLE